MASYLVSVTYTAPNELIFTDVSVNSNLNQMLYVSGSTNVIIANVSAISTSTGCSALTHIYMTNTGMYGSGLLVIFSANFHHRRDYWWLCWWYILRWNSICI